MPAEASDIAELQLILMHFSHYTDQNPAQTQKPSDELIKQPNYPGFRNTPTGH